MIFFHRAILPNRYHPSITVLMYSLVISIRNAVGTVTVHIAFHSNDTYKLFMSVFYGVAVYNYSFQMLPFLYSEITISASNP